MRARRHDVVFENGYEAQAWREIADWERRPDARLPAALRRAGRPIGFATDKLLSLPAVERRTERLVDGMRRAAATLGSRVDVDDVLRRTSSELGRPVPTVAALREVDLRTLDRLAGGLSRKYVAAASASGGAAGAVATVPAGSLAAIGALGADVVASTALLLRAIAAYGTQYGRDVTTPEEGHFAVGVFSLGAVAGDGKARTALLRELHALQDELARGASWQELSRHSSVPALQGMFDKVGLRVGRRKVAQVVPLFGIAAGGALGASLADQTCRAAYMQYRRRYLLDKYPELSGRPALSR